MISGHIVCTPEPADDALMLVPPNVNAPVIVPVVPLNDLEVRAYGVPVLQPVGSAPVVVRKKVELSDKATIVVGKLMVLGLAFVMVAVNLWLVKVSVCVGAVAAQFVIVVAPPAPPANEMP
jgi:hypothetical protein